MAVETAVQDLWADSCSLKVKITDAEQKVKACLKNRNRGEARKCLKEKKMLEMDLEKNLQRIESCGSASDLEQIGYRSRSNSGASSVSQKSDNIEKSFAPLFTNLQTAALLLITFASIIPASRFLRR